MIPGIFFLLAGPTAVGKSTLLRQLLAAEQNLVKAISVTTRSPRNSEKDGLDYFFWDEARFKAEQQRSGFLEHANVHGKFYGTPAQFVDEKLAAGIDVIKDIDIQGVVQLRQIERFKYPRSVAIFVLPPSREEMLRRLGGRNSEDRQAMEVRLKTAEYELARIDVCDYVVINDTLSVAVEQLRAIRSAEHCRRERRSMWWSSGAGGALPV